MRDVEEGETLYHVEEGEPLCDVEEGGPLVEEGRGGERRLPQAYGVGSYAHSSHRTVNNHNTCCYKTILHMHYIAQKITL